MSMISRPHSSQWLHTLHNSWWNPGAKTIALPKPLVLTILALSLLPFVLNLLGVDFSSPTSSWIPVPGVAVPSEVNIDSLHQNLAGSFIHTLLEWSAFCTAIFTVVLALVYFYVRQDVTTPILGVTLFCAGTMDAFHTLAADRLITSVGDNPNLIPFTWALCRLCNAGLTMLGVSLLLEKRSRPWTNSTQFVALTSLAFGVMSYGLIQLCATHDALPPTTFPDAIITRPWDVIPLILFLISGFVLFPRFYQKHPSLFSHALIISTIPNAATQLHMAFGSTALFDNHFNIAHFLKIIAYLVPFIGLILDYANTYQETNQLNRSLSIEIEERKQVQQELKISENRAWEKSLKLEQTLRELQKAQSQLVQSEKMSSLGQLVAGIAHEINNPVNFIHGNLHYAHQYVQEVMELLQRYEQHYPQPQTEILDYREEIDLEFLRDDLPRLLSSMQLGADRIRTIVQSLRIFSRLDESEVKDVDIHEGIDSTLMILQNRLKAKGKSQEIEVIRHYGALPNIECCAGQLNQVFMNILSNAIDALEDQRNQNDGSPQITISTAVVDREWVMICIQDNGPGLSDLAQANLFNPFFTTKPVGKGTGLGLSISYQIIHEKHQGQLRCISQPGAGAEFVIEIPIKRHSQLPD